MKFGHLLKSFAEDAALPDTVCLNYKKLKKLIKAQKHNKVQQEGEPQAAGAGPATAASSDEDEFPPSLRAAPTPAAEATAAAATTTAAAAVTSVATVAPAAAEQADGEGAVAGVAEEDREFIYTLNEDLSNINSYFMEQEEDAVIRLRALEDRLAGGGLAAGELEQLRNQMVDFHGELVLMLHWSLINYAAVAKILKKHDKLTGSRLRAPVLASVLHQPFLSTESISHLVKEAERHVQELTQLCGGGHGGSSHGTAAAALAEGSDEAGQDAEEGMEGSHVAIYKRTRAALHMLNDMQATAATPSTLLPPSTANSDAHATMPGGKKPRTVGEPHQAEQQHSAERQQSPLQVEAH